MAYISDLECCFVGNSVTSNFHEKLIEKVLLLEIAGS